MIAYYFNNNFSQEFKNNTGKDPLGERANKKIKLILLQAVEKARK